MPVTTPAPAASLAPSSPASGADGRSGLVTVAAFAAVYVIWGSTYLGIVYAIEAFPPLRMAGMRFIVAGLLMVLWGRARRSPWPRLVDWRHALVAGGLMMTLGNGALSVAVTKMPTGIGALLIATVPMWMVVIDAVRTRQRPGALAVAGVLVGTAGAAVLAGTNDGWKGGEADPLFVIMLLGGCVAWALGSILSRESAVASMRMRAGMQMLSGGALLLLASALWGEPATDWSAAAPRAWLALAYLVLFGSVVAFTAYVFLLKTQPAATVSTYAFVNPLVAITLGVVFLAEPLSPRILVAGATIVGAVVLVNRSQAMAKRRRRLAAPEPAA